MLSPARPASSPRVEPFSPGGAAGSATSSLPPPSAMVKGMKKLLEMHNSDELQFLGEKFRIPIEVSREDRLRALQDVILTTELAYRKVLTAIWEGIIVEYWRSEGKGIKHYRRDLRNMVWEYWMRERAEAGVQTKEAFVPVYTQIQGQPDRVVEEKVTDDDRVASWLKTLAEMEAQVKDAEHRLRLKRDYEALMDFFAGNARLRTFEQDGRSRILVDLQLTRKHLETANARNAALHQQMVDSRQAAATALADADLARRQCQAAQKAQADMQEELAQLKKLLGDRIEELTKSRTDLRGQLKATQDQLATLTTAHQKLTKEHKNTLEEFAIYKTRAANAMNENQRLSQLVDKQGRQLQYCLERSAHEDIMSSMYFTNNALLAARVAELEKARAEREVEIVNIVSMIEAEQETRTAMVLNPAAFADEESAPSTGRGRSPTKKKGASKKGGGKSKSPKGKKKKK